MDFGNIIHLPLIRNIQPLLTRLSETTLDWPEASRVILDLADHVRPRIDRLTFVEPDDAARWLNRMESLARQLPNGLTDQDRDDLYHRYVFPLLVSISGNELWILDQLPFETPEAKKYHHKALVERLDPQRFSPDLEALGDHVHDTHPEVYVISIRLKIKTRIRLFLPDSYVHAMVHLASDMAALLYTRGIMDYSLHHVLQGRHVVLDALIPETHDDRLMISKGTMIFLETIRAAVQIQ